MIKRILVALDPDEDTPVATQYAIWLAKKFNASLTGLAVVDTSNIYTNVGGGEINKLHYARNLWEELSEETRGIAEVLLDSFKESVEEAGVKYTSVKKEGASFDRIIEDTKYHDLLVLGRDSHFFYNEPQLETKTLARVVKGGVAPTLVVTGQYRQVEKVLVAFDGSGPAARSLKSFIQLMPFGKDIKIDLVHVSPDETKEKRELSESILQLAEEYLLEHEFQYITKTILSGGKPGNRIFERIEDQQPDLTVLGAHSVSAIRRVTFGSTTHDLITKTTVPLFLNP